MTRLQGVANPNHPGSVGYYGHSFLDAYGYEWLWFPFDGSIPSIESKNMSTAKISLNFERPDFVSKKLQGERGPFAPLLMTLKNLVDINKWQLKQKSYPLLYKSGIFYHTDPSTYLINYEAGAMNYSPSSEWYDIPTLLKIGKGDCKNLVAYRVAELSHYYRIETIPIIKWRWVAKGPNNVFYDWKSRMKNHPDYFQKVLLVHVMVKYPDGRIEDPSKILGMGGEYL